MICWLRGSVPTIEQPRGSKLVYLPAIQAWLHCLGALGAELHQHDIDLGLFGAPTQKPIMLYSPVTLDLQAPLQSFHRAEDYPATAIVRFDSNTVH